MYIYVYMYIYICVCVTNQLRYSQLSKKSSWLTIQIGLCSLIQMTQMTLFDVGLSSQCLAIMTPHHPMKPLRCPRLPDLSGFGSPRCTVTSTARGTDSSTDTTPVEARTPW